MASSKESAAGIDELCGACDQGSSRRKDARIDEEGGGVAVKSGNVEGGLGGRSAGKNCCLPGTG